MNDSIFNDLRLYLDNSVSYSITVLSFVFVFLSCNNIFPEPEPEPEKNYVDEISINESSSVILKIDNSKNIAIFNNNLMLIKLLLVKLQFDSLGNSYGMTFKF